MIIARQIGLKQG